MKPSVDPVGPLETSLLPPGVTARIVPDVNGLEMHILEAGAGGRRPVLLLLHGFPELAYSWRSVMPLLADAGFHVVAPDQRGFGRTIGWDGDYDGDVASFRHLNLVTDILCLLQALDVGVVAGIIGHDMGAAIAGYCTLIRPDLFKSVVMMSAPFVGPQGLTTRQYGRSIGLDEALGRLDPPRKHYTHYYSTRQAAEEMRHCPEGVHNFLRAYFHVKSGDWDANVPRPLAPSPADLAHLPTYYVMNRDAGMAQTVRPYLPPPAHIRACRWMTDAAMAVFAAEYARTGFQGGLQWYRVRTSEEHTAELRLFSGLTLDAPSRFIAGAKDWGIYQTPGALDAMRALCPKMETISLIAGAGHWVQQENPKAAVDLLLDFLREN